MSFASVLACLKPVFNPSSNRRVHWPRRAKFRRNPSSPTRQNSIHDSTYNSLTESRTHEADIVPARSSPTPNTALNVFKFALETLSSASDNIPVPGVKFAIDTLLTITRNIQQSSANAKGFDDLAERIKRLWPIVLSVKKDEEPPIVLFTLLNSLDRELNALNADIEISSSQGRLSRFFNCGDGLSCLANHIANLDHIIADYTLATATHTLHSVTKLQTGQKELLHTTATTKLTSFTLIDGEMEPHLRNKCDLHKGAMTLIQDPKSSVELKLQLEVQAARETRRGGAGGKGGSFAMQMATQTTYEFDDIEAGLGGLGGESAVHGGCGGAGGEVEITEV